MPPGLRRIVLQEQACSHTSLLFALAPYDGIQYRPTDFAFESLLGRRNTRSSGDLLLGGSDANSSLEREGKSWDLHTMNKLSCLDG